MFDSLIISAALLLLAAGPAQGQHTSDPATRAALEDVEFLLGRWLVKAQSVQADRSLVEAEAVAQIDRLDWNGFTGLQADWFLTPPYNARQERTRHLYDPATGTWSSKYTPNYPVLAWPEASVLETEGSDRRFPEAEGSDQTGDHLYRASYTDVGPNGWTWTLERSYNGGLNWFAIQSAVARRIGDEYRAVAWNDPAPRGTVETLRTDFAGSRALAVDPGGNVYIGSRPSDEPEADVAIVKIAPDGTEEVFARGLAPAGLTFAAGYLYVHAHDQGDGRIVRIDRDGRVEHVHDAPGDALAVDRYGNAYTADWVGGGRVLRFTPGGEVEEVVVDPIVNGTLAMAYHDGRDRLYIGDWSSGEIHEIDTATGTMELLTVVPGFTSSNAAWMAASDDGLFVTGFGAEQIYRIDPETGRVTWIAGSGIPGQADGTAAEARFNSPNGIAVSPDESVIHVADLGEPTGQTYHRQSLRRIRRPARR